jgi:hypothetical protein
MNDRTARLNNVLAIPARSIFRTARIALGVYSVNGAGGEQKLGGRNISEVENEPILGIVLSVLEGGELIIWTKKLKRSH